MKFLKIGGVWGKGEGGRRRKWVAKGKMGKRK